MANIQDYLKKFVNSTNTNPNNPFNRIPNQGNSNLVSSLYGGSSQPKKNTFDASTFDFNAPRQSIAPTVKKAEPQSQVQINNGATNPAPVVNSAMKETPSLPPVANQFIDSLQQQPQETPQPTQPIAQPEPKKSPYLSYLESLTGGEAFTNAQKRQNEDLQRLADIRNESEAASFTARREREQMLNRMGTGVGANAIAANESIRRSSPALADLALRESAAARTAGVSQGVFQQMLDAGATLFEAQQAQEEADNTPLSLEEAQSLGLPFGTTMAQARQAGVVPQADKGDFTLGKDQVRFDAQGNIIATGAGSNQPINQTIVDSWVDNINFGRAKISDVPSELKNTVIEGLSKVLDPETSNAVRAAKFVVRDAEKAISALEEIEKGMASGSGLGGALRGLTSWTPAFGKEQYELAQMIKSVKDNIGIDALLNIKREGSGLGQVPQSQLETLQGLLGRLEIRRNPTELKSDIKDVLELYQDVVDKASQRGQTGGSSYSTGTTSSGINYTIEGGNFNKVGSDTNIASKVADAIMQVESGGRQVKGASGEFGAFQFMPETWKTISQQVAGRVIPQTPQNERAVAEAKIAQLLAQGNSPQEVALIWNTSLGGAEKPFVRKGVNKKGVAYDSGAYAQKVVNTLSKLT